MKWRYVEVRAYHIVYGEKNADCAEIKNLHESVAEREAPEYLLPFLFCIFPQCF